MADGDVYELDSVTNGAHHEETGANCANNLEILALVGLGAASNELLSIFGKLNRRKAAGLGWCRLRLLFHSRQVNDKPLPVRNRVFSFVELFRGINSIRFKGPKNNPLISLVV